METLETSTTADDVNLVLAAQRGDREAFGQLVERYEQSVYLVAYRRLSNHAEAQEVCQEVFIKALEKLGQLRDPACIGSWLRSVSARMAIDRAVRRAPATATEPHTMSETCIDRETPLATALAREERSRVRAGLRRLGDLDRDTLVAFYVKGQSLLEMSDHFDSPVGTIKRRLHVARKRLAKELEEIVAV